MVDQSTLKELNSLSPSWARWLAQDADGTWWAYEHEPNEFHKGWYENEVGRFVKLLKAEPNTLWKDSLQPAMPSKPITSDE
ncbi:MAG: hypothetical protein V3U78_06185 [Thiotrichaceae bacterium]